MTAATAAETTVCSDVGWAIHYKVRTAQLLRAAESHRRAKPTPRHVSISALVRVPVPLAALDSAPVGRSAAHLALENGREFVPARAFVKSYRGEPIAPPKRPSMINGSGVGTRRRQQKHISDVATPSLPSPHSHTLQPDG